MFANMFVHVADHAGGAVEVTQFWRQFFVRPKNVILIKRRGNNMKQKLLEMIQVTVWFHTD